MPLSFPSGSTNGTEQLIDVSIIDDNLVEGDEVFTVAIAESEDGVILGNDQRVIIIRDNDGCKRWLNYICNSIVMYFDFII